MLRYADFYVSLIATSLPFTAAAGLSSTSSTTSQVTSIGLPVQNSVAEISSSLVFASPAASTTPEIPTFGQPESVGIVSVVTVESLVLPDHYTQTASAPLSTHQSVSASSHPSSSRSTQVVPPTSLSTSSHPILTLLASSLPVLSVSNTAPPFPAAPVSAITTPAVPVPLVSVPLAMSTQMQSSAVAWTPTTTLKAGAGVPAAVATAGMESWTESSMPTVTTYWAETVSKLSNGQLYTTWVEVIFTNHFVQPTTGASPKSGNIGMGTIKGQAGDVRQTDSFGGEVSWASAGARSDGKRLSKMSMVGVVVGLMLWSLEVF